MTRVSVAVAVRDVEAYVVEALDSVLDQLGPDDELVVVDDGSTDATPQLLAAYGDRIRLFSPGPVGLGAARNLSIEPTRGELLGFVDGDDRWAPGSLDHLVRSLAAHPEADVVVGRSNEFIDAGVDRRAAGLRAPVRNAGGLFLGAMLARRAVFEEVPFRPEQPLAVTTDWLGRARSAGVRFVHVDDIVLERRLRPGSMTTDAPAYQQALLDALRTNVQRDRTPP